MDISIIETPSLGDRTYVVRSGGEAAVVDAQRDIDRILEELGDDRLVAVCETHVHNDYVTGGLELARSTGAAYHVAAAAEVTYDRVAVEDGHEIRVGDVVLRAVHTPGHTFDHLSWVVVDGGREVAVCTGGSMIFGSVGRTDLLGAEHTEELTRSQYRSVHDLADTLPGEAAVLPTHGFGSFCSSGDTSDIDESTIDRERSTNDALTADSEDAFLEGLLAGLDDHPAYYAHVAPTNRAGPAPVDLSPVDHVAADELRRRIHAGEWVVDLRDRTAFAGEHVVGSINLELDDPASTYLGWIIPWGTPVTLLADSTEDVAAMQRQLVRIGIDRPAGQVPDGVPAGAKTATYRVASFQDLADAADAHVLDVRRDSERADGGIPDSQHVPIHELLDRMGEVPDDRDVWVHCASGYRASIAASLLARSGRTPVLIDGVFDEEAPDLFDLATDGDA